MSEANERLQRDPKEQLFPGAQSAFKGGTDFPWHSARDGILSVTKPHSSQALTLDVFGTIASASTNEIDAIMNQIASTLNLPTGVGWNIRFEYVAAGNPLNETQRTQIDVLAACEELIIAFECKFTESGGGCCFQPMPLQKGAHKGKVQCNGRYEHQVHPVSNVASRCALTGKRISYWQEIEKVLGYSADEDHVPCPFAGSWYQWMRNIVTVYKVASITSARAAFVVAYVQGPEFKMAQYVKSNDWNVLTNKVVSTAVVVQAMSFQQIIAIARAAALSVGGLPKVWDDLAAWTDSKITCASKSQRLAP